MDAGAETAVSGSVINTAPRGHAARLLLAGFLVGGAPTAGQYSGEGLQKAQDRRATMIMIDRWQERLSAAHESLRSGDWKEVYRLSHRVVEEMVDSLRAGDNVGEALATGVLYRALAQAALRQEEEAVWYWHVARGLHPPMQDLDLITYGPAGAALDRLTLAERESLGLDELEGEPGT
ncbi:MAG: hypothetical protein ACRD0X_02940, partial [Thermoanaerobaculia bacterium]